VHGLVTHDSISLYRALNLRFVHKFSARFNGYRSTLRTQFFKESKFSFIYKFVYSFIKKTNVLFNHFNILLRGATNGEQLITALSGFTVSNLRAMAYSGDWDTATYFFHGGVAFRQELFLAPGYSDSRGLIINSALLLFSRNYFYLKCTGLGLGRFTNFFNNTSLFTMWQRTSFNKIYAT
jgi:hypothetical protein